MPVTGGEGVAAAFVGPGRKTESFIVGYGRVEVPDSEDRRNPFQGFHGAHPYKRLIGRRGTLPKAAIRVLDRSVRRRLLPPRAD